MYTHLTTGRYNFIKTTMARRRGIRKNVKTQEVISLIRKGTTTSEILVKIDRTALCAFCKIKVENKNQLKIKTLNNKTVIVLIIFFVSC